MRDGGRSEVYRVLGMRTGPRQENAAMNGDYSQKNDPYGIEAEYSSQSPMNSAYRSKNTTCTDKRGNTLTKPRGVPTQDEADAIVKGYGK
jgi:hypothetical protein